jgi:hypothetical protein
VRGHGKVSLLLVYVGCVIVFGTCAEMRKAAVSLVMSVRPSIRPHVTIGLQLDGFSWNSIFEDLLKIYWDEFKVCKSAHHHTIPINQPTRCNNFPSLLLDFLYGVTCFGCPHAHHQELNNCSSSLWFYSTATTTLQRWNQRLLLQLLSSLWWA